jgi:hypothetical protein
VLTQKDRWALWYSRKWRGREAGSIAQMVNHLPSNCEALSTNPSIAKKKKKKKMHFCEKQREWERHR